MTVVETVWCSLSGFLLLLPVAIARVRETTSVEEHLLEGQAEEKTLLLTRTGRWSVKDKFIGVMA